MNKIILAIAVVTLAGCNGNAQKKERQKKEQEKTYAVNKTPEEWKAQLSDKAYYILRQNGTERAFTGKYNKFYESGVYQCAGCKSPLYKSEHKFNSGTGWPSFDRGFDENLEYITDNSYGMSRTEVACAVCGGHLGHVFNDGPQDTTGKRHCINSAALNFKPEDEGK
ncbi:peptide-methionine (R)-S-oxide reductase MsrB [Ascidiimonas sp. W6]|uniref:peptide-methionine (R)-S-oxide reductase MsrB n=1 Tax=Ascidiimonas meishanensis TaxID=3128903 RepID=UPI0030EE98C5